MDTRAHFDKTQLHILENSHLIVAYLKSIVTAYLEQDAEKDSGKTAKPKLHSIGETFDPDKMKGRLFFNPNIVNVSSELESVFSHPLIVSAFSVKFSGWRFSADQMNQYENIEFLKNEIVDYFFSPIESSQSWDQFWADESKKMLLLKDQVESDADDKKLSFAEEKHHIRHLIAGAFSYKISTLWAKQNHDVASYKTQLAIFTLIVNSIGNVKQVITKQLDKTLRLFSDEFMPIKAALVAGEYKGKTKARLAREKFLKITENIRSNEWFEVIADNESKLLEQQMRVFNDYVKSPKKEDYLVGKLAKAILLEIAKAHPNLHTDIIQPVGLAKDISKLIIHLGDKELKESKYKNVLEFHEKHCDLAKTLTLNIPANAAKQGLFGRSASPLPPSRAKENTSLTPTLARARSRSFDAGVLNRINDTTRSATPEPVRRKK